MKPEVRIERLKHKDIYTVKEFLLRIIKDDFGYNFNPEWHWDIDKLTETYLENKNSAFYVAKIDNRIIGTIGVRPYDKNYQEFRDIYDNKNTLSIWRHYISKEFRRQGIGKLLLNQIELFAKKKNFKYIYLHTQKTIPGSLEYWISRDYEIILDVNDELKTVHLQKVIY